MTITHRLTNFVIGLLVGSLLAVALTATEVTGTSQQLLNGASASGASATVGAGFMPRCRETVVYIQWGTNNSGGVTIETAHDASYTGTWAPLAVVAWTANTKEDVVQITGIHNAIRTRISTVLGAGTLNTWLTCN